VIAYAAIDLRGGRVVQLVGGRPDAERISLPDPGAVTRQWVEAGFAALHVVDLDAALGVGDNASAIDAILSAAGDLPVQVGGGVRTTERAEELLANGATRVVVGTRAVEDRAWLEQLATRFPARIVVAADVRGNEIVVRGWTVGTELGTAEFLHGLAHIPLGAALVTDVAREGAMRGVDVCRFGALVRESSHPLIAAGGIATADDLAALADAGVAGAVLGMALYTGALDARAIAEAYHA
jgi:phosphoribosylformimino-5-aminoimidazole carboxamide ribotide isomerase